MLKRKATAMIRDWIDSKDRKCLVVQGARQTGKTYVIERFSEEYYDELLDKENHKFQYKEVEHGGRAQKYYSSIEWLLRADIVHLSRLVTDVKYDLDDYSRDDFFRAYTTDLSLLLAMKDFSLKQHIVENSLEGNSKGGFAEGAYAA